MFLIIIGGIFRIRVKNHFAAQKAKYFDRIIYFDVNNVQWYISDIVLPKPIAKHQSVIDYNNQTIHILGGINKNGVQLNNHWVYNIVDIIKQWSIPWNNERIIWIGFVKNENNDKCYLAQMPKDIIRHILKFLKVTFQ